MAATTGKDKCTPLFALLVARTVRSPLSHERGDRCIAQTAILL